MTKFDASRVAVALAIKRLGGLEQIAGDTYPEFFQDVDALVRAAHQGVIAEVSDERRQQVEDGRDANHDDGLGQGELALAAAAYACGDASLWPWSAEWWKPKDRRRNYVRAAALLIAEIERMDRAKVGKADA